VALARAKREIPDNPSRSREVHMPNRRQFLTIASVALVHHAFAGGYANQQVSLSIHDFGFSYQNGKLVLNAKDILINGLTIPAFSWSWIGMSIASGLLAGLGAAIFGALSDALFAKKQIDIAQLLYQLLEEFRQVIQQELQINDLRNYTADVEAYEELFKEYLSTKDPGVLTTLVTETAPPYYKLSSLEYLGYRPFMIVAGLRLSILQEYIWRGRYGAKVLLDFREEAVAHHNAVISQIDGATDPIAVVNRFNGLNKFDTGPQFVPLTGMPDMIPGDDIRSVNCHSEPFLSEIVDGRLFFWIKKVDAGRPDAELTPVQIDFLTRQADKYCGPGGTRCRFWGEKIASLAATRAKLKRDSTDMGQQMIAQWQGAKIKFP
jgi:hypothetical protein